MVRYVVLQYDTRRSGSGTSMRADDMILISVDDHIAEPADMFDQHVPARYRDQAPRVVTDERGIQQWWYGEKPGRNLGPQRRRRQAPRDVQRQPHQLRGHAPRLLRRPRARARHVRRRAAGWSELPQLDRVRRPGAQRGPGPGPQRDHDQGLQRLARRRVVRRLPRAVHPLRDPAAVRRGARRRPRCAGWPPRAATP